MRRTVTAVAAVAAVAVLAGGCGKKNDNGSAGSGGGSAASGGASKSSAASMSASPTASGSAGPTASGGPVTGGTGFKVCLVLDTGGVNDKSFNQSAYQGAQNAAKKNPKIKVSYVQSKSGADYQPNLENSAKKGCNEIIATGGLLAKATATAAKKYPKVHFALIDDSLTAPIKGPNVYSMAFRSEQGSYEAGYVAAAISKSHVIGTWGGINVGPQVTAYMDGYQQGAAHYDQKNGTKTTVLGWNGKTGSFLGPPNGFNDPTGGKSLSQTQIQQGADVIFPVAGGSGAGALSAATSAGGKVSVIWVDFPGCTNYPDDCKYIPTSSLKNIPAQVQKYAVDGAAGKIATGIYVGTLKNGGVGIDGFNQWDSKISSKTKSDLTAITKGINDGSIKITVHGG
ncbi:MAG: BMP family lipoprotein [Mycobacteriales bacterium]